MKKNIIRGIVAIGFGVLWKFSEPAVISGLTFWILCILWKIYED